MIRPNGHMYRHMRRPVVYSMKVCVCGAHAVDWVEDILITGCLAAVEVR